MNERWVSVPGWDVDASDLGRVRKASTGAILSGTLNRPAHGYFRVSATPADGSGRRKEYVHRLVCLAFHGPDVGRHVDHVDGDHANNRADNLRWLTPEENRARRPSRAGENHPLAKLTADDVRRIRSAKHFRGFDAATARDLGVSKETVRDARNTKTWSNTNG